MTEMTTNQYADEHGISTSTVRRRIADGTLTARRLGRDWIIQADPKHSGPAPGSAEWLRLMSASKVAAVLGVSPYQSPFSLWHEMKGATRAETTEVQKRGHLLEAAVLDWWYAEFDITPGTGNRQHTAYLGDWGIATLDDVVWTLDGMVGLEAKTTGSWDEWGEEGTDEIPAHYYAQAVWQLACDPALVRIYLPVLGPRLDFRWYAVERDNALIASVIGKCREFYDSLEQDVAPELDDHKATLAVLKRMHPDIDEEHEAVITDELAARYIGADLAAKAAEAALLGAKSAVLAEAGTAKYVKNAAGQAIARRQPNRSGVSLVRVAKTIPTPAQEAEAA